VVSSDRLNLDDAACRNPTGMLWAVWVVGALAVIASVVLMIGAVTADPMAGETGQPAALLGLIGLCFGGVVLIAGMLARSIVTKAGRS
jgi:hypothetical protein